ncbi:hypothetical protein [Candidatus Endomicrobiellum trichonymphae]|nr:hypothetical protein [Candidatus Endomicrobium trichonymphae]
MIKIKDKYKLVENIFPINNPFRSSRTVQKALKIINKNFVCNIIVLSLLLCSCGKKQALLNTAITEKSEVVSELKSELAKIQKELKEKKEKLIEVQEELEKAIEVQEELEKENWQNLWELYDNRMGFFLLGLLTADLIVLGCICCTMCSCC